MPTVIGKPRSDLANPMGIFNGRSRGGLIRKIHAVVDANGNPIALNLREGQAHDGRSATDILETVEAGQILLVDLGYDCDALRAAPDARARAAARPARPRPRRAMEAGSGTTASAVTRRATAR